MLGTQPGSRFGCALETVWLYFGDGLAGLAGLLVLWKRSGCILEPVWLALEPVWRCFGDGLVVFWNRFDGALEPIWLDFGTGLACYS